VSLTRFWFEFDLTGHCPPAPRAGEGRAVDGGSVQYRWLSWGAGVTAYDEADALALLRDLVGAELPPRLKTTQDVAIDREALGLPEVLAVGDPSRRGVWLPSDNLRG
jgi:hypothetical protein